MTLIRYLITNKAAYAIVSTCLVLVACEQAVKDPLKLEDQGKLTDQHDQLVWPQPPTEPKLAYIMSFSSPADLGIKKGFLCASFFQIYFKGPVLSARWKAQGSNPPPIINSAGNRNGRLSNL